MRAFSDSQYDYYELTQPLGLKKYMHRTDDYILQKGAIFVHDKDDDKYGSGEGCLKLCWTPEGNCYGYVGAGEVKFCGEFRHTDLFKLAQPTGSTKKLQEIELKCLVADLEKKLAVVKEKIEEL